MSRLSTPGWQHRFRTWSTRTFWQQRAALPHWADNAASGHGQQGPFATTSRPSTLGWQHSFNTWSPRTFWRQRVAFLHWTGNAASGHGQPGPLRQRVAPFSIGIATQLQEGIRQPFVHWIGILPWSPSSPSPSSPVAYSVVFHTSSPHGRSHQPRLLSFP